MPASYREIDYRIRPGKHSERNMMVEAFRRLRFGTVESYQYVGLGSVYFSDFLLMHRALGISRLVSIERAEHDRQRFEANKPFECVEMMWGDTSAELPKVDFDMRSIVWLDYDGRLGRSILGDIREVAGRAVGGTVLAVTVQCRFDRISGEDGADRSVEKLVGELGSERVPHDISVGDIRGSGTGRLFRNVIQQEIAEAIAERNAGRHSAQEMRFKQILNFRYEDGVKMMTVAFVFYDAGQEQILALCGFEDLAFFRDGEESFDIEIPKLTPREIKFLEAQMPRDADDLDLQAIPSRDASQYARIYRYFPNLAFVDG